MKSVVRKLARYCGIELHRYRPANSPAAQLASALSLAGIDMVFDIGANQGQFAREIREHGYKGKIVSFEPLTTAREKLLLLSARDPSWLVHDQAAVGSRDGDIQINISGNSVSSSILPMLELHSSAAIGSSYVATERVRILKLDNIAGDYLTPESNLFVKIDTQGYEWHVLDGAGETLSQARGILCELSLVPLYEHQRLWRDIVDRLDADGFMLWALQKGFTDPRTGQSLQMDGIFLRKSVISS